MAIIKKIRANFSGKIYTKKRYLKYIKLKIKKKI